MVSPLLCYQLVLLALGWLFVMLCVAWPSARPTLHPKAAEPEPIKPKRRRSTEPKPFGGLTTKPSCPPCEQEPVPRNEPPPVRPEPMPLTNRRPREVEISMQCYPHRGCDYRGWLGLGNLRAHGGVPVTTG